MYIKRKIHKKHFKNKFKKSMKNKFKDRIKSFKKKKNIL